MCVGDGAIVVDEGLHAEDAGVVDLIVAIAEGAEGGDAAVDDGPGLGAEVKVEEAHGDRWALGGDALAGRFGRSKV